MPYPNEHAARLQDPKGFDRFRRVNGGTIFGSLKVPKTISIIWGHIKEADAKAWAVQALRFPTKNWDVDGAKKWIKDNKIKTLLFEPAKKKTKKKIIETHKFLHSLWEKDNDDLQFMEVGRSGVYSSHEAIVKDMSESGLEHGSILIGEISKEEPVTPFEMIEHIFVDTINEFRPLAIEEEPLLSARILKADGKRENEERIVYGIVLEPNVVDAQDDIVSEDEIRKACHYFMEKSQTIGYQHSNFKKKFKLLESYIAPSSLNMNGQEIKKGTWLLVVKVIDDPTWKEVKKETITGFSIAGTGTRTKEKD